MLWTRGAFYLRRVVVAVVVVCLLGLAGSGAGAQGAYVTDLLASIDSDGDGCVSGGEWDAYTASTGAVDTDGDKCVSAEELVEFQKAHVWEFIVRDFEHDATTLQDALFSHIQTAMGEEDSSAILVQAFVLPSEELVPDTAR